MDLIKDDDLVAIYLGGIGKVPLLNVEEEVDLAKRIEKGRQAKKALRYSREVITREKQKSLELAIDDGKAAQDHLVEANTRLVISIAKKYTGRGVFILDLIQEGNIGLLRATKTFDHTLGNRFGTYATWWIRQAITRAIANKGRTIRMPVHMYDKIGKMYRISNRLEQEMGRRPTPEEIAKEMGVNPRKIIWMMRISLHPISLEMPTEGKEGEGIEFGDFIKDTNSLTSYQIVVQKDRCEKIEEMLSTLTPREARIIRLRFGLSGEEKLTLEEIGEKFGLVRERIRQIENKAKRRLRHSHHARALRDYLD